MGKAPVRQQLGGLIQVESRNEINIREALGNNPIQHRLAPQLTAGHRFANTGTQNYMCQ